MTDHEKAAEIAAKLRNMTRLRVMLTAEDILMKCSREELDFYHAWLCGGR